MKISENFHIWHICHNCKLQPIVGARYECQTCPISPLINLCGKCYEELEVNPGLHPAKGNFSKVKGRHDFKCIDSGNQDALADWFDIRSSGIEDAPVIKTGFVIRPEFHSCGTSTIGGYGFIVRLFDSVLMLTALHVMDELLKKKNIDATVSNKSYNGKEIPNIISEVSLYNIFEAHWASHIMGRCASMLTLPNARIGEKEPDSSRDIAAFVVENPECFSAYSLASKHPKKGDAIWMSVNMPNGERTRQAVVVECTDNNLIFRFDSNANEMPPFTSGAPLLNRKSEVVGINVGATSFAGQDFGHANHVENIREHLNFLSQ